VKRNEKEKLLRFANRLIFSGDRGKEAAGVELRDLLERPPHRPKDVSGAYRKRLLRALCAELLFLGRLPAEDVPDGREEDVQRAYGSREEADELAAFITASTARRVRAARRESRTASGAWELASETGAQVRELDAEGMLAVWRALRLHLPGHELTQ
jgi:hypothetical protein